jgi:hypothetical protein
MKFRPPFTLRIADILIDQWQSRCLALGRRDILNAMTDAKPKRRWFSFSLRTLLLWVTMAAISLGFWLEHRRQDDTIRQQDSLIKSLNSKKVDMTHDKERMISELGRLNGKLDRAIGYPTGWNENGPPHSSH